MIYNLWNVFVMLFLNTLIEKYSMYLENYSFYNVS